ncbi:6083_t:CDS:2 [Gigaspora margarita]|uniref:6083_t:CDS:1 n=1 Tax=Gigaspora margarita TaxID=4874 RepID=A0ABN7V4A6_GIGMA|nr:6083_t:CDS:2 [Gigaspora margarita]
MSLFQNGKKFEDYIPYGKIKKISKEVHGAFSIIEASKYNEIMVAVKIPEKINNKRKKNLSIDEIRKHDYFYCKYVINFRGITVLPNETANCLIMDYAENGNLHEYLSKHSLEQDIKLKMAINIAEGLFECHRHVHKIIHLNINSENILVDKNLELKVGGFGYDSNGDLDDKGKLMTYKYYPAMKKHYKENPELSDIYSYGLVLLEIAMNGVEPYRDMEINEIKEAKKGAEISINISDLNIPGSLEKTIKECCNSSPSERPALADIVLRLKNLHYKNSMENLEDDPEKLTKFYFAEENTAENKALKIHEKWHSIVGKELPLIEPQHYVKLGIVISPPKTLSAETHENVAAVLPYIRQKVKMWGVYILKAENFNDILIEYKDEKDEKDKDKDDIDEEDKDEEDEDEESSDDEPSDSESNDKNQKTIKKNRLSRFDCIATLFASAECTVAQDIFRTISQFPIAFPLLIPELDKAGKYKVMLPLFTGPIIKWETSNGIVENHLFKDPFKMIVAVRIGTSPKGKTTIINQLMSSNYMFTSCNEPGADYGIPHMVSGSIEFVWLTEETCGSGFWNNVIKNYYEKKEKEILLLANLHGNALDYPDQIEFLKQFPSRFLVFLMPGYDKTQKDKFKALIDEDKAKYIYVNPKKKGKNEANKIYTDKLIESKEIKKVYEMFKNILETNFVGSTIVANGLKMGKSFQFAGSTEFLESKRIVDFIVKRKCYHIKMKVMQLQQKQKEEFKNKLDLNKNKSNPNKNKSIPIKIWKKSTELQELMRLFADILALPINKRRQALSHLEREVSRLSMEESSESRCDAIRKRKDLNNLGIKNEQEKGKSIRDDIAKLWQKVDDTSLGIEHFFRELGHIYDIFSSESDDSKIIFANGPTKEKILKLPKYYADLLINGNTIELLDGDSMTIYESWFLAICKCINKRFPKLRIFVISIIGLQSSGKSTLLNALFACKFAVSVGRCTKGLFMRLLFLEKDLSDHLEVDAFILIDTEGLGAPEKMGESDSEKKDRRLATFAMGISNLTIINVLGESMKELTEILQIAIVTMTRLEKAGMSPDIIMVQHVPEKNELKLSEPEQRFREALRKALETVEKRDGEVGAQNLDCLGILDERIKSGKLLKLFAPFKDGATAYSQPSKKYHEDIVELYNSIISDCKKSKSKKNFLDWSNLITCYWDAVDHEDFAVQFKNLNEMYEFFKLKKQVANLKGIINKAFAKHKYLIKKCILKQCKHQKQSNEDSIDPIRKECQQLIKKIYDVSEFTKEECCKECKEVIEERGKLDKDLEDKKNEKSREETNQTIEKYIYQCRDSIYIELKQMADAILMRNKLSNTHHKFIDEQLEKVLKSHNELSDEKDREREAENIWKSLREKIKSENKDSTINVNVKIDKEVTEGYEHRGSKQFRNMYSANTFPNLSMINKYEASFVNNFLNSTPLQPNELISIQTQIGNTVDEVLSDIDCFRDGIVGDLILKIDEKLSTSGRKYKPGSKQIIHAYALHYFKERMNKIQDEWNKNNTPVGVLDQKEDEYLKKILTRLQYGRSHQSEGLIAGDYLLRAIQKKAIDTENTDRINYVLDKEDWVKDSERVRTKYFIELADKVYNNDKDKGVQHFLKPRESIEKWFKDKVNSVTREDQGKIYEKTFNTEFKYVRQSILNCNGYDDIKEFVDDYMSDNDIDYELNTEDDTIAQQNFNIVQDAIIKELDDGKRNGRYQLKDNLLLNPSESKDVMEKLGCTEPCFWCGALCCEPRGHVEGYGKWKIHRTNHQPRGLSGTHDMNSKELRTKACHDVSDDANMHYHEKIKKWKIAISEDFNDWEFKPLKYSDDLSVLMRWFFHELHEKLAESHNLKAANESDLNSDCKLDKDYNKIICALKTKLDQ